MWQTVKVLVIGIGVAYAAQLCWRRWQRARQRAERTLARLQFPELREQLQAECLAAAAATGKPRGLRWLQCQLDPQQRFAIDRVSGELYAMVRATVRFAALPGGGMEDVAAVGNLRCATAVFKYQQGRWTATGRVLFNLEPEQALQHYEESLRPCP